MSAAAAFKSTTPQRWLLRNKLEPSSFRRLQTIQKSKKKSTDTVANSPTPDTINNNDDDEDKDVQDILDHVSDAEALMACRAYLVKRRRWSGDAAGGWSEYMRRQAAQQQTVEEESTGFFWEDLSQLQYWNPLANPLRFQQQHEGSNTTTNITTESIFPTNKAKFLTIGDDNEDENDDVLPIARHSTDTDASSAVVGEEPVISLEAWHEAYLDGLDDSNTDMSFSASIEDTEPSQEHLRRSAARRKLFSDAVWKAHWYERRWGQKQPRRVEAEERLHHRLSALWKSASHAQVLAPVASMTQDEMTQAIVEYVMANRKRSASQFAWRKEQSDIRKERRRHGSTLTTQSNEKLPRDTLLQVNKTALLEQQNARSERARKAYETRRERQGLAAPLRNDKKVYKEKRPRGRPPKKEKIPESSTGSASSSCSLQPRDALQRIEMALDAGALPEEEWVDIATKPGKLPRRKQVLVRLLRERFGLRGKQRLPIDLHNNRLEEVDPITQRRVSELGQSCALLLRQKFGKSNMK